MTLTYEILHDEDALSPRIDYDNFGTMVCWHRLYKLGDEHNCRSLDDIMATIMDVDLRDYYDRDVDTFLSWCEDNNIVILPVYLYDHSGLVVNTTGFNCKWDSGQVGFIYASHEDVKLFYGEVSPKTVKLAYELLEAEIETYNMYLQNDVYGIVVKDENGNDVESCWGFYGYDNAETEAKLMIA
jgi:hypothetical protein